MKAWRDSLHWRLLAPTLLLAGLLGLIVVIFAWWHSTQQMERSLEERARLLANAVLFAAESSSQQADLQRFVTAIGAGNDIESIVLAGSEPLKVIAGTQQEWLNRPLDKLDNPDLRADMQRTVQASQSHYGYSEHESVYEYLSPVALTVDDPASGLPVIQRGALVIHLSASSLQQQILLNTLKLSLMLSLLGSLLLLGIYLLLRRLVLQPAGRIVSVIERQQRGDQTAQCALPLRDEMGRIGLALDTLMAYRLLREEALAQARDEATAANTAKSAFLANMSHEIRTPMNAVLGYANLLQDSALDDSQREYVDAINVAGESLLGLINDILDYSKIEAGKLELEQIVFDARLPFEDAVELLAGKAAEKQLELAALIEPGLPPRLIGDPGRLRQIVLNLLSNAVKFTSAGQVVLRVKSRQSDPAQVQLQFSISDTGIGMDEATLAGLFAPFTQADSSTTRRFGGTGLGLSICKRLCEAMGGQIGVSSEPGKGTTFTVDLILPVDQESAVPEPAAVAVTLRDVEVLVVDDHPLNVELLRLYLESWGMRVTAVASAAAALQLWQERATPFPLLLLDEHLPDMDGLALAQQLREAAPASRMVLLTSFAMRGQAQQCRAAGFSAYLAKPYRARQLHELLHAVLGEPQHPVQLITRHSVREQQQQQKPHLLVAEDNPVNQRVITLLLEKLGYRIDVVDDGAKAVAAVQMGSYPLVLMDCQMPEMDGLTATRTLRDLGSEVVIVALTANAFDSDREACLAAGMNDFLAKPVKADELAGILGKWLNTGTTL
ncbi:hybrid sensor histidine kinase/response regulator [Chitinilyticum piscinae]|uniref:Virulence sensor protein BvgS n=1 Tax=Chitinilyticum piscinae TaxID=2866724 RepID=A0A8J7K7K3_9NEIS|nr:response regulator [Chitinilyticum piscinae]MBE9608203.1 response regulator [Chitinilyticum piscinae]